jgi:hypothetical protein
MPRCAIRCENCAPFECWRLLSTMKMVSDKIRQSKDSLIHLFVIVIIPGVSFSIVLSAIIRLQNHWLLKQLLKHVFSAFHLYGS